MQNVSTHTHLYWRILCVIWYFKSILTERFVHFDNNSNNNFQSHSTYSDNNNNTGRGGALAIFRMWMTAIKSKGAIKRIK